MTEYLMHYIGRGLYKQELFEREVRKLGVQRAIGFGMLGSLEFGQPVLLAQYTGRVDSSAEVFGYFIVNGVSHNLPEELCEKLYHKLDIVEVRQGGGVEARACGSYSVGATAVIRDSLEKLSQEIKELLKAEELSPNNFKWFVKGEYVAFERSVILTPATFSQGFVKVDVEELDLKMQKTEMRNLVLIQDYKKKRYLSKRRAAAVNSHNLDEYGAVE